MNIECKKGKHVPVATLDRHNRVLEIFCQNCTIGLTRKDYEGYFGVGHGGINWGEKGDWDDVYKLDTDPVNFSDYFEKVTI